MFFVHPLPTVLIEKENPEMAAGGYYRPVQYPGYAAGKGNSTTYGFNLVINARASKEKQEVLHDLYRFILAEPVDAWKAAAPFPLALKGNWTEDPLVKKFPHVEEILTARDNGVALPRCLVYNEMADAIHRAVQRILLEKADIKASLDTAAAEIDRANAAYRKA